MPPAAELPRPALIHDMHELSDPPIEWIPIGAAIAAALILALGLWILIRWFLRRRRARLGSAAHIATDRLWHIEPAAVPARELFKELHAIVIEYLSARGGFAADKLTSPEIVSSLNARGFGPSPELTAFLADSDRARFSPAPHADEPSGREPILQCRAIIDHVEAKWKEKGWRPRAV